MFVPDHGEAQRLIEFIDLCPSPFHAAAWGVYLHAAAGDALAERQGGPLGFLARELLDEVPRLMQAIGTRTH